MYTHATAVSVRQTTAVSSHGHIQIWGVPWHLHVLDVLSSKPITPTSKSSHVFADTRSLDVLFMSNSNCWKEAFLLEGGYCYQTSNLFISSPSRSFSAFWDDDAILLIIISQSFIAATFEVVSWFPMAVKDFTMAFPFDQVRICVTLLVMVMI